MTDIANPPEDYTESQLDRVQDALQELTEDGRAPYSLIGTPAAFFGSTLLFETATEAKAAKKSLANISKLSTELVKALEELSGEQVRRITKECARVARRKTEPLAIGDYGALKAILPALISTVCALEPGLSIEQNRVNSEVKDYWNSGGRHPNWHARLVALAIAKIYIREHCKLPSYGSKSDDGTPSTLYSRKVQEVFNILGIDEGFHGYSEWAVKQLEGVDLEKLREDHQRREAYQRGALLSGVITPGKSR